LSIGFRHPPRRGGREQQGCGNDRAQFAEQDALFRFGEISGKILQRHACLI